MLFKPFDVSSLGVLFDLTQQLHCLGFIAGFACVIFRDDRLNLDRYDKATRPN
jgi:hypothetical protein